MKKIITFIPALLLIQGTLLAQAEEAAPPPRDNFSQTLIMIAIALLFFYIILWRPEQKRRKAQEAQRSSLKKGDKVTAMGIIGTIVKVQEQTVILRMVDGSKIEVLKMAISDVIPATEEESAILEKEERSAGKKTNTPES